MILAGRESLQGAGATLALDGASGVVERVLEMTGLRGLLSSAVLSQRSSAPRPPSVAHADLLLEPLDAGSQQTRDMHLAHADQIGDLGLRQPVEVAEIQLRRSRGASPRSSVRTVRRSSASTRSVVRATDGLRIVAAVAVLVAGGRQGAGPVGAARLHGLAAPDRR